MSKSKNSQPKIILNIYQSADKGGDFRGRSRSAECGRPHIAICPGYGSENFPFPSIETLVKNALSRVKRQINSDELEDDNGEWCEDGEGEQSEVGEPDPLSFYAAHFEAPESGVASSASPVILSVSNPSVLDKIQELNAPSVKQSLIPRIEVDSASSVDATLYAAGGGLAELLNDGKFDAIVADRFDSQSDKVSWARTNMAAKYLPAIDSLDEQLVQLRGLYLASLPRTLDGLRAQNPGVPEYQLLEAAIEALDAELTPIIDILRIWTDSFGQRRSGKYRELDAIVFSVEQAHYLFEGNDPTSEISAENKSRLNTRVFRTGCVYVARFSSVGPATLPAGPIGAHAFEVPYDERNLLALMLILYLHEFRHNIFHDVEGLADELVSVLASNIAAAHKAGEFKLSRKNVKIGKQQVPLLDLIIKFFVDAIGEVDADISGGVLLGGPAYLYNMLSTFCAFNAQGKGLFNVEQLLRTDSLYELEQTESGQMSLTFLPHPPDYIRAHLVAAALDAIEFPAEAEQCRHLADQAVGLEKIPETIIWKCAQGKDLPEIAIPVADLKAVAPIVARALIYTPLKSLGDVATADITNWTKEREERAQILAKLIMKGKSELPANIGNIHVTYVIAAATIAYWGLCKSGYHPRRASAVVQENALRMIEQVRTNYEQRIAVTAKKPLC